ncbi:MAG: calcium-binding protein [Hyphomicrobium sp.]|jgi:hypothetical protein
MPAIRVERLPVQTFGLGFLGFDHLQLVFQPGGAAEPTSQERWFVIEGVRELAGATTRLGVEGWHGGTTLAEANGGASGAELAAKIGTAEFRGSRELVSGQDAHETWASLVSFAADIEAQGFPYIAYALPSSPLPTLNSTSLIGSLLYHAGFSPAEARPFGTRLSPGMTTLLATSGDDTVSLGASDFTAILAGAGQDTLFGSDDAQRIDKLYGGKGDDRVHWSAGFNIFHGGEPSLAYAADGVDTVTYAGTGKIRVDAAASPVEHYRPDFIVTHPGGTDHLFSIEELSWDASNDTVTLGQGVGMIGQGRVPLTLRLGDGDNTVDGSLGTFPTRIIAGTGQDTIIVGSGPMTVSGGPGADTFIIAAQDADLTILDAGPEDRLTLLPEFAEARAEADPSGGLLIRILGDAGASALVHVRDFEVGDLGISNATSRLVAASTFHDESEAFRFAAFDHLGESHEPKPSGHSANAEHAQHDAIWTEFLPEPFTDLAPAPLHWIVSDGEDRHH